MAVPPAELEQVSHHARPDLPQHRREHLQVEVRYLDTSVGSFLDQPQSATLIALEEGSEVVACELAQRRVQIEVAHPRGHVGLAGFEATGDQRPDGLTSLPAERLTDHRNQEGQARGDVVVIHPVAGKEFTHHTTSSSNSCGRSVANAAAR